MQTTFQKNIQGLKVYPNMRESYLDLTEGSDDMNNIQELISRVIDVEYEPQK